MTRSLALQLTAALAGVAAAPAHAHLVETGFGEFYDGVAHVVATPADLLVVVALALLAGQRGTAAARSSLLALPGAWLVGGAAGALGAAGAFAAGTATAVATTLTFGLAGLGVALDLDLRRGFVAAFAALAGVVHGAVNGATMVPGGAGALALAGAVTTAFCLFAILAAQATTIHRGWARIALRAGGSWLAAAAVLSLG